MKKFKEMIFDYNYNADTDTFEKTGIRTDVMIFGIVIAIAIILALSFWKFKKSEEPTGSSFFY